MREVNLMHMNSYSWANAYHVFTLDYKERKLWLASNQLWEGAELIDDSMWHFDRTTIHERLSKIFKDRKEFFCDHGQLIDYMKIKSAFCRTKLKSVEFKEPLPLWYPIENYVVTLVSGQTASINRFLINREYMTKKNTVNGSYGDFNTFVGKNIPRDLYHPVKWGLNKYFHFDDYHIKDFKVFDQAPF